MSLLEQFEAALAALGGTARLATSPAEAGAAVVDILRTHGVTEAVAWSDPLLERIGVAGAAAKAAIAWVTPGATAEGAGAERFRFRDAAARAGAGVTGAEWAVAETGTLAFLYGPGRPRSAALLPPLHVAVLPLERLLPATSDLFRELGRLGRSGQVPAALNLVTGPSRSADIEDVLVRKMHGPGELAVVFIDERGA